MLAFLVSCVLVRLVRVDIGLGARSTFLNVVGDHLSRCNDSWPGCGRSGVGFLWLVVDLSLMYLS